MRCWAVSCLQTISLVCNGMYAASVLGCYPELSALPWSSRLSPKATTRVYGFFTAKYSVGRCPLCKTSTDHELVVRSHSPHYILKLTIQAPLSYVSNDSPHKMLRTVRKKYI